MSGGIIIKKIIVHTN